MYHACSKTQSQTVRVPRHSLSSRTHGGALSSAARRAATAAASLQLKRKELRFTSAGAALGVVGGGQEQVIKQLQATLTDLFTQKAAGDLQSNRSSVAGELTSLFAIAGQLLQAANSTTQSSPQSDAAEPSSLLSPPPEVKSQMDPPLLPRAAMVRPRGSSSPAAAAATPGRVKAAGAGGGVSSNSKEVEHAAAKASRPKRAVAEAVSQASIDELQKKLQEVKSQISEMSKQEPHRRVGRP